ncbi:hypothetical protein I4U23_028335 [Adineta vaga]|nr:hypothetical protein I4U23_028335 [Adineta vaga]
MTKGGNSKPTMLGRLIFGEKRKQQASPSRHRSATRTGRNMTDIPSPGDDNTSKNPINVHDWAAWRTKLNEQMGNETTDRTDMKQMRQFLHANSFYQQHSRDPSNGRYNGVQLLFSIPHAKLKSEINDSTQRISDKTMPSEDDIFDQNHVRPPSNNDHIATSVHSISPSSPLIRDKTISQLLPKAILGNTGGFLPVNEQMIITEGVSTHRSIRTAFSASDRVHSTLQKAVKDGNVLEKIKAFEMQAAAAAQAESTIKLGTTTGINNNSRIQSISSSFQTSSHRTLSPPARHILQQSVSPQRIPYEAQHQYTRSHRSRNIHPTQQYRDGHIGPMMTRESRKGAHVLEPAHGDIILKRRTPSQKTANDDDYTVTAMSSLAQTNSQGHPHHHPHPPPPHHHHQRQQHHRTGVSRSRHRQEIVYDKRTSNHHDNKKYPQKQKEPSSSTTTTVPKPNIRRRWLKGHKDAVAEVKTENIKKDLPVDKSKKSSKIKKKTNEKEKILPTKKATSPLEKGKTLATSISLDNNRVYGVPNASINEPTKSETTSPQLPSRIDEENECDHEEKTNENKVHHKSPKEVDKDLSEHKECETTIVSPVEQRPSKTKYQKKLSSTDGEILSKVEDDNRFSHPTDDHAHHSELNDEDEECKSEGDVFIEESSTLNLNPLQQTSPSVDDILPDRRWQWSKESHGLIDKGGNRKKKGQPSFPLTLITRKNKTNQNDEQTVYETPQSEQLPPTVKSSFPIKKTQSSHPLITTENDHESDGNKHVSKQILHAIMNSMNHTNKKSHTTNADEFFENGPHTNPEETLLNSISSS